MTLSPTTKFAADKILAKKKQKKIEIAKKKNKKKPLKPEVQLKKNENGKLFTKSLK